MAGGSYYIPRNTKGEGRILYVFTPKAFIATAIGAIIALCTVYPICKIIGQTLMGWIFVLIFGAIGFAVFSFKIPDSSKFDITRKAGGEYIYEIIQRYFKFKMKKNRIYLYFKEEKENE